MTVKRFSLRFNLAREDERRAWDSLQRMESGSINKEIIARINGYDKLKVLSEFIRQAVAEELHNIKFVTSLPQPDKHENDEEELDNLFSFLDVF